MKPSDLVVARREEWQELERLTKRAERRRLSRLSGDELLKLGHLYRSTTSDLAIARRDFPSDRLTTYLNALVARAHPLVYREEAEASSLRSIGRFARYGFPAAYRRVFPYTATAFVVFCVSAFVADLLVLARPQLADVLMPGQAQELRAVMQHHHLWMKSATSNHSVAANFIMLNNIQVAFFAFAGGMLLGSLTLLVLFQNGVMFGAVAAMVAQYGLGRPFWSFVLPHGVIELSVIFMCGGAGLLMGDAILRPGRLKRTEAVRMAAGQAVLILFGAAPLLVVAGTIEGFLSPSDLPDVLKLLIGLTSGVLLYSYLLGSRPKEEVRHYGVAHEQKRQWVDSSVGARS